MKRRNFLKNIALATGSLALGSTLSSCKEKPGGKAYGMPASLKGRNIYNLDKPLAIAMWDYSWLLRHHRYGEFENFDKVISELAERGYNAVRIDTFPQFVAADTDGTITEEFRSVKHGWAPCRWGNDYTINFRPREALLEFLPLCEKYGIKVSLSTWFMNHSGNRGIFMEEDGLLRAWDETLKFLEENDMLGNVINVDLLNEYPFWHGYDWLKKELDSRSDVKQFQLNNPNANMPDIALTEMPGMNLLQQDFYNHFSNDILRKLKTKYPELPFFISFNTQMPLDAIDLTEYCCIDYHQWMVSSGKIINIPELDKMDQSLDNKKLYDELLTKFRKDKADLTIWLDEFLNDVATHARKLNVPWGNTEGWGAVGWIDLPETGWEFIRESAEIAIDLCRKHDNCKFICTSNFTHPQFKGMWEDIEWHRRITDKIKA